MNMDEKDSLMGKGIKSLVRAPFDLINLPFKSHKQYYGKPSKYEGSFVEQQRLKKVLKQMYDGQQLSDKDIFFMDRVNDFLSQEGSEPIDQSTTEVKGGGTPYKYQNKFTKKSNVFKNGEENSSGVGINLSEITSAKIQFKQELKPKNAIHNYEYNKVYGFKVESIEEKNNRIYIYVSQKFLEKHDYLILVTSTKDFLNKTIVYNVYQNNHKIPTKNNIFLGKFGLIFSIMENK